MDRSLRRPRSGRPIESTHPGPMSSRCGRFGQAKLRPPPLPPIAPGIVSVTAARPASSGHDDPAFRRINPIPAVEAPPPFTGFASAAATAARRIRCNRPHSRKGPPTIARPRSPRPGRGPAPGPARSHSAPPCHRGHWSRSPPVSRQSAGPARLSNYDSHNLIRLRPPGHVSQRRLNIENKLTRPTIAALRNVPSR